MGECYLDDDGGAEVAAVEAGEEPQALCVRVGPVFYEDGQSPGPGIWIEYQERYGLCRPEGPVLLTPEVWRELDKAVEARLGRRKKMSEKIPGVHCLKCGKRLRFASRTLCRKCFRRGKRVRNWLNSGKGKMPK